MREFDQIKDMVYDELDVFSRQGKLTKDAVCMIGELVDILKDIGTVEMFEEGIEVPEDEYSLASGYRNGGYSQKKYYLGGGYDNGYGGNSYRSGRGGSYGYGRHGGRSGYSREDSKEHMIQQLHNLMNEAQDESDRQSIHHLIEQMENK